MANIKSAKERAVTQKKRAARNKAVRSEVKTEIKKLQALITANDKQKANELFPYTCSIIDKAVAKGVLKKNNAANKKSKLANKINAMA